MFNRALICSVMICLSLLIPKPAVAQSNEEWQAIKARCGLPANLAYNDWNGQCPGKAGNQQRDNGAAQRAQAAAAEAQRKRDAELARQRTEAENKRRIEEVEKQAKFIDDRDAAASTLRGSTGTAPAGGVNGSGLRGSGPSTGLRTSQPAPAEAPNLDPMVVDARHVPTGLPKSVEAEIPDTPSGARVRKAFEAVMDHDWTVALAWFQDALNHDPGNAGIERLIDLAQFTMEREKEWRAQDEAVIATLEKLEEEQIDEEIRGQDKAVMAAMAKQEEEQVNENLAKALDDYNRYYLPTHPAAQKPVELSAVAPATGSSTPDPKRVQENAKWKAFFDAIFGFSPKPAAPGPASAAKD
jgi:hypothetical protein